MFRLFSADSSARSRGYPHKTTEIMLRELRCHYEPGDVGSRMGVKEDRKTGTALPHADLATQCCHELFRKTFKKVCQHPCSDRSALLVLIHYAKAVIRNAVPSRCVSPSKATTRAALAPSVPEASLNQ